MEIRLSYDAPAKMYRGWDLDVPTEERVVGEVSEADVLAAMPADQQHLVTYAPVLESWARSLIAAQLGGPALPEAVLSTPTKKKAAE